ncbi:MAG: ABC transporter permease, partial [Candidatus Promineifilaceae bacterium]
MRKMLLVAKHQFMKEASKRSFILVLLILPGFFILTVGLGFLFSHLDEERAALGYIDQAGLIVRDLPQSDNSDSSLIEFESRDAAMTALDEGRIVGFYVIDKQYEETHNAELVYYETPPYEVVGLFNDTVRFNLASDLPQTTVRRILDGADVTIRATDVNREYKGGDPDFTLFLPLIVAAIFAFLVMTTSGYLTEVIVDEKENRTMEIVVTSLSTGRMMAGKILGALGIATVQLVTWVLFILAVIWIGGAVLHIDWLQSIEPGWGD